MVKQITKRIHLEQWLTLPWKFVTDECFVDIWMNVFVRLLWFDPGKCLKFGNTESEWWECENN